RGAAGGAFGGLADMVQVTFNVDQLMIGAFQISSNAQDDTFVSVSNLCCLEAEHADREFAAYYRVLTHETQPADPDRKVPVPIGVTQEEEKGLFFEVNCYKPAKITIVP
ncbi:MAG TPA: hypothetical protein VNZ26_30810, partial [Vicinamibacterales bacterium]|nr:hypothetical protein [Vicinamibacterales bacterium]